MPMEAGAVGVQPAIRPQTPSGVDGVTRRDGESASDGFRPQTNVAIENAIDDMAGVLSKIAANENEAVAEMPQDLQKVLRNVLKNAFSFENTLADGLGSTIESQRFSMDQLASVARTLTQMASLAEKGYDVGFSDGLQTLLMNLKEAVTSTDGRELEPVLILKESFELLNGKAVNELPSSLQQLIAQLQGTGVQVSSPPTQTSNFAALKKLIQYFMPRTSAQATSPFLPATRQGTQQTQMPSQQAPGSGYATASQATETVVGEKAVLPSPSAANKTVTVAQGWEKERAGEKTQAQQTTPAAQQQTADEPLKASQKNQPMQAENQRGKEALAEDGQSTASAHQTDEAANSLQEETAPSRNPQTAAEPPATQQGKRARVPFNDAPEPAAQQTVKEPDRFSAGQLTAREAKELLMQQPFENSTKLMSVFKELAKNFLQKGMLSAADAQILRNFLKDEGAVFSQKEARQLETLLRLCQQNIPATVQQAAVQQNLPELPRLWVFMQLCDLISTKRMTARQLKKAGHDVADFVASMKNSMEGDHAIQPGQRSMNFMMPLYLGENEKGYPAYIHVYDETQPDKDTGALKKETWLRLCMLTDYLGAVELTCRVYEKEHLDLRLFFASSDTAKQFRSFVPELRRKMRSSKLRLEDIAIGAADGS